MYSPEEAAMRQYIRSTGLVTDDGSETRFGRRLMLALAAVGLSARTPTLAAAPAPVGQLTWGVHVSLAPTWFDPAEMSGAITSFMLLYALHDAVMKPLPDQPMAPSLAEAWSTKEDGLSYEFVLRKGATFHNGDPVTADDVRFSFERYRGADHARIKERVSEVEVPDPGRIRFKLKEPWPDFPTFYVGASGAGWVVPRRYVEKVGDAGFKKAPVGAGPYKFVSFTPGVELVLEAFDGYWRKTPKVKRLLFRVLPDELTRVAALKRGEIDIAYSIRGGARAFYQSFAERKLKNIIQGGFASLGNVATRLEAFVVKGGAYVYGSYPDNDVLYQQQAVELDHTKRQAMLTKVQQLVLEKAIFAPIFQLAFINAVGPRVDESGFGLIKAFPIYGAL
jgi:peptide/nickel transport system substrate-binding protein